MAAMSVQAATSHRLDRLAMGLSGLCLVHCLGTALLVGVIASVGGILGSPLIHEVGLTFAMIIGVIALGRGALVHGFVLPSAVGGLGLGVMAGAISLPEGGHEAIFTMAGVMIVALGHRLNVMAGEDRL